MDDTIYFYIPEPMVTFDLNTRLFNRMETCPEHYRDNVKIGAVYGCFPGNIWNGGRVCKGMVSQDQIKYCLDVYNMNEMPVRFTWTNIALEEEHLADPSCNWITRIAENGINEILVNDPKLEEHIRKHYPKYPLISSTTKCLKDIDEINAELEKDYKLVVLDYGFNNDWEKLEQIKHHEKCEILVNAACNPNCPNRAQHYLNLSKGQIDPDHNGDKNVEHCRAFARYFSEIKALPTFVSWEAIEKEYVPRGFRHFKIEGRNSNPLMVMEYYLHYLVKDEFREVEREFLYDGVLKHLMQPFFDIR